MGTWPGRPVPRLGQAGAHNRCVASHHRDVVTFGMYPSQDALVLHRVSTDDEECALDRLLSQDVQDFWRDGLILNERSFDLLGEKKVELILGDAARAASAWGVNSVPYIERQQIDHVHADVEGLLLALDTIGPGKFGREMARPWSLLTGTCRALVEPFQSWRPGGIEHDRPTKAGRRPRGQRRRRGLLIRAITRLGARPR